VSSLNDLYGSDGFRLFEDETLRQKACDAADFVWETSEEVERSQLQPIETVIQAGGLPKLKDLADNQRRKNTKENNQHFWEFIYKLLFDPHGVAGNAEISLRIEIQHELSRHQDAFLNRKEAICPKPSSGGYAVRTPPKSKP